MKHENWDENASDIKELKEWWKNDQEALCAGYGNHHERFAITGIPKDKFTDVVRALKEAEEKGLYSYDTAFKKGKNSLYYLECNTAKDFNQELEGYIREKCSLTDSAQYPHYFQDCWDNEDWCEINPVDPSVCHIKSLEIFSEAYLNSEDNYDDWDVRFTIVDDKTGLKMEFGGGYLSREQALSLWDDAKRINKTEDYKESLDPDIGYLLTPPDEDLDI